MSRPTSTPVDKNGMFDPDPLLEAETEGSLGGLFFNQDKVTIVAGRMSDPARADEVVVDQFAAQVLGLHVGQVIPYGVFTNSQLTTGAPTTPAIRTIDLRIVGIGVWNDEIVQDQIDKIPKILFTPALTRPYVSCCTTYAWSGLKLKGGASEVPAVERAYLKLLPPGDPYYFHVTSVVEAEAEQAVKPESVALGVFGLIAALTALIIAGLAISRQLQIASDDRRIMRTLGASPTTTTADGLIGITLAILLGTLLAAVFAVLLSPISFGPVRAVLPSPGISIDWTTVGLGVLVLLIVLGTLAVIIASAGAPRRQGARRARASAGARLAHVTAGLPPPAAAGIRFALLSGRGPTAVAVRAVIAGVTLAVAVVTASLTFGSSLSTLVSHPRLFGWNWDYFMQAQAGYGDIPQAPVARLSNGDRDVSSWTGIFFDSLQFDGQAVPVIGGTPGTKVAPPLLAGHSVDAANQVVFGRQSLLQLHKQVGDTVRVTGGGRTETLHIVGEASMPTMGIGFGLHMSIGTGAVVPYTLLPVGARDIQQEPTIGPNGVLIRFNPDVPRAAAIRSVQRIADRLDSGPGGGAGHPVLPGPAAGRDHQLQDDGIHPRSPGYRSGGGGGVRRGPDARRIGPSPSTGPGIVQGARFHPGAARPDRGLAGHGHRHHRHDHRSARRHRAGPVAVEPFCPRAVRGPRSDGAGRGRGAGRRRRPRTRQPRRRRPGAAGGAHTGGPRAAGRLTAPHRSRSQKTRSQKTPSQKTPESEDPGVRRPEPARRPASGPRGGARGPTGAAD